MASDRSTELVVDHWIATGDGRPCGDLQLQISSWARRDHVARQEHGDRLEVKSLVAHQAARRGELRSPNVLKALRHSSPDLAIQRGPSPMLTPSFACCTNVGSPRGDSPS